MTTLLKFTPWVLKAVVSIILLQTLFFKFGGAKESIDLFTNITTNVPGTPSAEALMRIGSGIVELIAVILLLLPRFTGWGAAIALATMLGAIATHLYLGIIDELLILAVITAVASAILAWIYRSQLPILKRYASENTASPLSP
ncbi:MAG: putative membrane protein YphA (DoxX/SURF4 family) [Rubritalea sp.]|jgi:uncharacterized membrane protein YphA (DoxX/SURF4 family)